MRITKLLNRITSNAEQVYTNTPHNVAGAEAKLSNKVHQYQLERRFFHRVADAASTPGLQNTGSIK